MTRKELFYAEVLPLLQTLIVTCRKHGMNVVAGVDVIEPDANVLEEGHRCVLAYVDTSNGLVSPEIPEAVEILAGVPYDDFADGLGDGEDLNVPGGTTFN